MSPAVAASKWKRTCFGVACLLFIVITESHADMLFDQMTNNASSTFMSSWRAPEGNATDAYVYDNFLLTGDSTVTEVWFVGTAMQSNFTVRFYTGMASNPDLSPSSVVDANQETAANYIKSYAFTAADSHQTAIPGSSLYQHHVVLPTTITLNGNTVHWVRIVSESYFEWARATQGRDNRHQTYLEAFRGRVSYDGDLAFQLIGTPAVVPTYVISANAAPSNGGVVTGAGTYAAGSTVTLTATPSGGRDFLNWSESGAQVSTDATYTFTASKARTLKANFVDPNGAGPYVITASANPSTGGNVGGAGTFNEDSMVNLDASPQNGVQLVSWTENGYVVSTSSNYNFVATMHRNLSANFTNPAQGYFIYGLRSPANTGTVIGTGGSGWSIGNDNFNYGYFTGGTIITLTATPPAGYHLARWTRDGETVGLGPTLRHVVVQTKAVTAVFEPDNPVLTLSASPAAGGTVTGDGIFTSGDSVTCTATPAVGYEFASWTEGSTIVSTSSNYTQTLNDHRTLIANFVISSRALEAAAAPPEGGSITGGGLMGNGAAATLTAVANPGWYFVNWTEGGVDAGASAIWNLTVTSNRSVVAHFAALPAVSIVPPAVAGGDFQFAWPAAQAGWQLQESTNLLIWTNSARSVVNDAGTNKVTVPVGSGGTFFRLVRP